MSGANSINAGVIMMETRFEAQVFVWANDTLESLPYAEYLREYWSDETTSPRGIEPRLHVRERDGQYQIYSWGVGGNHPHFTGVSFDTEEEVDTFMLEAAEERMRSANDDTPLCYGTIEEVYEAMAAEWEVDTEVAASIYRKQQLVQMARDERNRIAAERMQALHREYVRESEAIVAMKAAHLNSMPGESYKETCTRLSATLGQKIDSGVFHSTVKSIRRR